MESENAPMSGTLAGGRVRIDSPYSIRTLSQDGYGDCEKEGYLLEPYEALYLMSTDRLSVVADGAAVEFDGMLEACQEEDPDILSKYLVYRDLRSRGYVAKDGFGFGTDFRVYDRGDFGQRGAKLLVFGLNEGRRERAKDFCGMVDEIAGMGKEPVVAVIESRGEIIYYRINRIKFSPNAAPPQA